MKAILYISRFFMLIGLIFGLIVVAPSTFVMAASMRSYTDQMFALSSHYPVVEFLMNFSGMALYYLLDAFAAFAVVFWWASLGTVISESLGFGFLCVYVTGVHDNYPD